MMTNGDPEGQIFPSHSHTIHDFFSCSPLLYTAFHDKKMSQEFPEYAEMGHDMMASL